MDEVDEEDAVDMLSELSDSPALSKLSTEGARVLWYVGVAGLFFTGVYEDLYIR